MGLSCLVMLLLNMATSSLACTAIGVGKAASASGYPMVGHSQDSGEMTNDVRLVRVPRKQWPAGSYRAFYNWQAGYPRVVTEGLGSPDYAPVHGQRISRPLGHIPQVAETWGYWDAAYGVQNEWGLSIGESTCTARTVGWSTDKPYGYNLAGIEDLSKIALERCKTVRCAIRIMGEIAVEHGFYSADGGTPDAPDYTGSSECLILADATPGELWIFNILTGKNNASAIWAAQKIPDNHVAAVGNTFTIRRMNLSDSENFLHSPGIADLALEMGWWSPLSRDPPEIFDFFGAYGYTPTNSAMEAHILSYYSGRRMWRVFSLLSPEEGARLDPNTGNLPHTAGPYPNSVPAATGSVTLQMLLDTYRDHYEGTPYDLTKGMAAGPFGNPNRGITPAGLEGLWERALSMYRASWSFALEAKPNFRSVTWFGWDAPHGTAYLPLFGASSDLGPESYHSREGCMSKFSHKVAFWAFNFVNQYQDLNFRMINADVQKRAHEIEKDAQQRVRLWSEEADKMDDDESVRRFLTKRSNDFAQKTVDEWWEFAYSLLAKYGRYVVTHNESANGEFVNGLGSQEYPAWWLSSPEVGFTTWTPNGPYHGTLLSAQALKARGSLNAGFTAWTPNGPYHGTLLSEQALKASGSLNACVPILFTIAATAGIAYYIGVQRGKRSKDQDAHYLVLP